MDAVPLTLPYYAPADKLPDTLPTHEEILASTDFLLDPSWALDAGLMSVRVGEHFVAKYGERVSPIEGENMLFVKENTSIVLPELYAMYRFDDGKQTMIVTENIQGTPLRSCRCQSRLAPIINKLQAQIEELRRIPAPGYFGFIGRRPLQIDPLEPSHGPYTTVSDMMVSLFFDIEEQALNPPRFINIIEAFIADITRVTRATGRTAPVFSHGALYAGNVILREDDTPVILNWGSAGFYPAFYEYYRLIVTGGLPEVLISMTNSCAEECVVMNKYQSIWQDAIFDEADRNFERHYGGEQTGPRHWHNPY
ncbi:kinase-like protein [Xylaria intraflava]|nr:kinase-like protein [Xylaria intraflava]